MRRSTERQQAQAQAQAQPQPQSSSLASGFVLGALMMCMLLSVESIARNQLRGVSLRVSVFGFDSRARQPSEKSYGNANANANANVNVKPDVKLVTDVYIADNYDEPRSLQIPTKRSTLALASESTLASASESVGIIKPLQSTEHFRPDQGLETIPFRIVDAETVQAHLRFYYGTNSTLPIPPLIYFVTPTYRRITQIADLIRLANTLDHDCAIYWIVVEDAEKCSRRVRDILDRSGLPYAHVAVKTPPPPTTTTSTTYNKNFKAAKGVEQRNAALDVVEYLGLEGVVYFGDDDNAYDGT